jgi:uncharacterized membrane protein
LTDTHPQARPRPKIESLSDLVFGLALSVGAISLVGNVTLITSARTLLNDISVFAFGFIILITVWMRYTKIMSVLPLENRWTISLNTALLFTVSIEPFLFNVLEMDSNLAAKISSQFYAVDLGVMMLILGGFMLVLSDEERNLIPKDLIKESRIESLSTFVAGGLFLVSILGVFWVQGPGGIYWRFYLWIVPFAISSIRRRTLLVKNEITKLKKEK